MNPKKFFTFLLFAGLSFHFVSAQDWATRANDHYENDWSLGAGFNIVDDSGTKGGGIIDPGERWNFSTPFQVNAEYYLNNKFSFNAMLSMNKYKEGKNIDDTSYILKGHEAGFFAADLATKFYFRDMLQTYTFDPYVSLGFGYTKIGAYKAEPFIYPPYEDYLEIDGNGNFDVPAIGRLTLNVAAGFNYWFSNYWGANFNLASKFGVGSGDNEKGPNSVSNQVQFSFGAVYLLSNR